MVAAITDGLVTWIQFTTMQALGSGPRGGARMIICQCPVSRESVTDKWGEATCVV